MSNAIVELTGKLAARLDMGGAGTEMVQTLKATAFKGQVSDAQMIALLAVANQYGLNPWTKEIYAFPDKNNGIVPVVGVDGWSRIINSHPQFDGMDFDQDDESCTCRMYRKDRKHAISTTEYFSECKRDTGPWRSHPKRMLRHKAMIQCARLAFGYVGIYDQDEAERIVEINPIADRKSGQQVAESVRPGLTIDGSTGELIQARDNLIADLELVAKEQGIDAYAKAWGNLTPDQRKLVGADEHARLKSLAPQDCAVQTGGEGAGDE